MYFIYIYICIYIYEHIYIYTHICFHIYNIYIYKPTHPGQVVLSQVLGLEKQRDSMDPWRAKLLEESCWALVSVVLGVWGLRLKVWGFRVLGFRALGLRVWGFTGSRLKVYGLGFRGLRTSQVVLNGFCEVVSWLEGLERAL